MTARQRVRIIAGKWRSRLLTFPRAEGLRPTGDRIRETLFNWLAPNIAGSSCLDLFSGSGALCFEALSRGAEDCLALEQNPQALATLTANKALLGAAELTIRRADTVSHLSKRPDKPFDIAFIDPPFELNLLTQVCTLLEENHWLASNSLIYCELSARHNSFAPPANWRVARSKTAGEVHYILYSRIEPAALFE
ncbi:16S rRNA (guanine(966)-N(2))-methyltransferase RsmD [Porticoccaceae bacterium]|nr:16S rRNA (guanine(966)-N(2))-methyltransferase RsmD [Porticoccaceae bacterium]